MSASVASSATTYQPSPAPQTMQQNNHRFGKNKSRDPLHQPTPSVTPRQPHASNNSTNDDNTTTCSAENNHHSNGQSQTQSQTQAEDEEWLMACRCESGKTLVTLLSCLQHVASSPSDQGGSSGLVATQATSSRRRSQKQQNTIQPVTVFCMPSGFTFHVFGPAKQSEASMELQKSMFSHYQVLQPSNDDDGDDDNTNNDSRSVGEFCVNLCTVLDALQLLGPLDHRISVGLSYNLQTEIFKVELLQDVVGGGSGGGVLCTAAIPGLNSPADDAEGGDSLAHAIRSAPIAVRMMVRSSILKELLPEWSSVTGATSASITVSRSRGLELVVEGHFGECWVQIPATGDHMVSPLEIDDAKKAVSRKYPLHSLLSSMKGLEISEETCISINGEGIMAIQHKTIDPTGQGCSNFVDFMMTCLEEDLDNDDESVTQVTASVAPASPSSSWRAWENKSRNSQSLDETTTTTKTRRNRRRKNRTTSPSHDDDGTATTTNNQGGGDGGGNDDDVEQGSSDTEGEAESPMERQQRQNLEKRQREALMYDDDDDDDDDPTPISAIAPLFGSVVREAADENKSETPRRRRRRRRRSKSSNEEKGQTAKRGGKSRSKNSRGRGEDGEDDNGSEGSKNYLLAGSSQGEKSESDSSDDEPLDITNFPISTKHHQRDSECSSPEIVYGER